jgi:hypothetical protein
MAATGAGLASTAISARRARPSPAGANSEWPALAPPGPDRLPA